MVNKRLFAGLLLFLITALFFAGYGKSPGNKDKETVREELTGSFSGTAGCLSFYQGGSVLVNLSEDYVWLLEKEENNQTYGYVFIHGNEKTTFNKAVFERQNE